MKEKIKKYQWLSVAVVLLLVAGFAFYWHEWRPAQIKQKCYAEAEFDKRAVLEMDDQKRSDFINMYYQGCLRRFGLEK